MEQLDEKIIGDILLLLVVDSPYRRDIVLEVAKTAYLINENEALNHAMSGIINGSDFINSHAIDHSASKEAIKTIHNFFEYLYFITDKFLKGVE